MMDRDIFFDIFKLVYYDLVIMDLDFMIWFYKGIVM